MSAPQYQVWPRGGDCREFDLWLAARWYQIRCWFLPSHVACDQTWRHLAECEQCRESVQDFLIFVGPCDPVKAEDLDKFFAQLQRRIECEEQSGS